MKKIYHLLLTLSAATLPIAVSAQDCIPTPGGIPCPGQTILASGVGGVRDLIGTIANWMFVILLIVAVLYIILAAYQYLFSAGNEENVAKAHKMLIYAVVAIAVAFLARGIVFVVQQLVGGGFGGGGYGQQYGGGGNNNSDVSGNACIQRNNLGVCIRF